MRINNSIANYTSEASGVGVKVSVKVSVKVNLIQESGGKITRVALVSHQNGASHGNLHDFHSAAVAILGDFNADVNSTKRQNNSLEAIR